MSGDDVRPVFNRVGQHQGSIYIDLARQDNKAISINADGWQVIDNPPIIFHRPDTQAPLPLPQAGNIDLLAQHINIAQHDMPLVACWLIDAIKGNGSYHALIVNGKQGSAKSWTSYILSSLIDPQKAAGLNSIGKKAERDIGIDAYNQFVLPYDNVSFLTQQQSDCLCRLATGAGVRIRKLHTDAQQVCFGFARPVILNGIPDFASAPTYWIGASY